VTIFDGNAKSLNGLEHEKLVRLILSQQRLKIGTILS
jgi:hypothetical protein